MSDKKPTVENQIANLRERARILEQTPPAAASEKPESPIPPEVHCAKRGETKKERGSALSNNLLDLALKEIWELGLRVASLDRALFRHICPYPEKGTEPSEHGAHCECKICRQDNSKAAFGMAYRPNRSVISDEKPRECVCLRSGTSCGMSECINKATTKPAKGFKATILRKRGEWYEVKDERYLAATLDCHSYQEIAPGIYQEQ